MANSNADDLPGMGFSEPLRGMHRAGSPAVQTALQEKAWSTLKTYRTPAGRTGSRLANEWLGSRGWRVQLVPHALVRDPRCIPLLEPLAAAALHRGVTELYGTDVHPEYRRPSAVWRVPVDSERISAFFEAHYTSFHALFPQDLGFAIHANEGDYAVFAGPEAFLREALPPDELGRAATAELKADLEQEHGVGFLDGILSHYEPFMLDD
jgi:hypothetical protein